MANLLLLPSHPIALYYIISSNFRNSFNENNTHLWNEAEWCRVDEIDKMESVLTHKDSAQPLWWLLERKLLLLHSNLAAIILRGRWEKEGRIENQNVLTRIRWWEFRNKKRKKERRVSKRDQNGHPTHSRSRPWKVKADRRHCVPEQFSIVNFGVCHLTEHFIRICF